MRMRKILMTLILMIAIVIGLAGCGYDPEGCYDTVAKAYPDAIVMIIPGEDYRFIVIGGHGEVRYIETMNSLDRLISQDFEVRQRQQQ